MDAHVVKLARVLFPIVGWAAVCLLALEHADVVDRPATRRWIERAVLVGALVVIAGTLTACAANVAWPRRWDFPPLYTAARAAWNGESFYRPDVLERTFHAVSPDGLVPDDWLKEVGYWYLPPSIFTILPLGRLGYRSALATHYAVQWLFFVGTTWLLHRMAPLRAGLRGALQTSLLLLAFGPLLHAFTLAQTLFGALFFMTLGLAYMEQRRGALAGVALGLGFVYKHCLLVVGLMAFVCRRWKTGLAFVATLVASLLLAFVVYGSGTYRDYATFGPARVPASSVLQEESQSLLRLAYWVLGDSPDRGGIGGLLLYPPFVVLASVLALSSAVLCARRVEDPAARRLQQLLLVPLSLLVFPGTLSYLVGLLAPVWVLLLARADRMEEGRVPWAVGLAALYALALLPSWGPLVAMVVTWIVVMTLLALAEGEERAVARDTSPSTAR